jgi:hypothetical protein
MPGTTYYIHRGGSSRVQIIGGVTAFRETSRWVNTGTYRDTGWGPGAMPALNNVAATLPAQPVGIVGIDGKDATPGTDLNMLFATADEHAHIPPRPYRTFESGYMFAIGNAVLPPVVERWGSVPFNVAQSLDVCVTNDAHGFKTGDKVIITGNVFPGGLVGTKVYTLVRCTAITFTLLDAGVQVNYATPRTDDYSNQIVLVKESIEAVDTPLPAGVMWVPGEEDMAVSTSLAPIL